MAIEYYYKKLLLFGATRARATCSTDTGLLVFSFNFNTNFSIMHTSKVPIGDTEKNRRTREGLRVGKKTLGIYFDKILSSQYELSRRADGHLRIFTCLTRKLYCYDTDYSLCMCSREW